ncbi:MAG: hypothetical protein JWO57_2121 [Pseudonocardiales bacterium]|nr:hypothetical protein [Pseudonocardiales bacterium]
MSQPPDFTKPPEQATPPPPGGYAAAPPPGYAPAPPPGGYAAAPPPNQAYGTPPPGGYPAAPPPSHAYATPGLPPLPPGTELASAGRRIGTYLVDVVLLVVTLFIGYLIWMLIVWARGQTPGKQVMGLRVYHLQNQRAASWGQMFLRQVVGGIVNSVFFSIGLIVSVVFLFTDPLRRTVPDRIAGTIVLSDPNKVLEPH